MSDQFYLQDSRQYVGNDMLFWRDGGRGYATDLREAAVYTREQALAMHQSRETDIPWPKEYIDARTRPTVDMQNCKRAEALAGTGIEIIKPKPRRRGVTHCQHCGGFLSERQIYTGCPKCSGDNCP